MGRPRRPGGCISRLSWLPRARKRRPSQARWPGRTKRTSGPPGNQNAFQHGLRALQHHRTNGALDPIEQGIRKEILAGLVADKGGEQQMGTATRVLAEVVASDAARLTAFNRAIDHVLHSNQKARYNLKSSYADPNIVTSEPFTRLPDGCTWMKERAQHRSYGTES